MIFSIALLVFVAFAILVDRYFKHRETKQRMALTPGITTTGVHLWIDDESAHVALHIETHWIEVLAQPLDTPLSAYADTVKILQAESAQFPDA